jgi:hypothetical protein
MAFFLTGYPSRLPLASRRGDLGLHDGDGLGTARFIAVEFDTYRDSFDPCDTGDHIAIDINTTRDSMNTTCLPSSSLEGSMKASITFNSMQYQHAPRSPPCTWMTILLMRLIRSACSCPIP